MSSIFLYNFHKISNIKLLRYFFIIYPKLIQLLILNFFQQCFEIFTRFSYKCLKYFHVVSPKFLKNFLQICNISFKFPASNSKFVFQNSPVVRIFPKFFKMNQKLYFYNFSRLFQNFLKIISCFLDNFSQVFSKMHTMSRNFHQNV